MKLLRPTYVEVDLDIIKHNINEIRKVIDKRLCLESKKVLMIGLQ